MPDQSVEWQLHLKSRVVFLPTVGYQFLNFWLEESKNLHNFGRPRNVKLTSTRKALTSGRQCVCFNGTQKAAKSVDENVSVIFAGTKIFVGILVYLALWPSINANSFN